MPAGVVLVRPVLVEVAVRGVAGCGRFGCRLPSGSDGGAVEFPAGADGVEQRARTRRPGGEDGIGGQLLDEPVGGGDTLAGADGVVVQLGSRSAAPLS